MNLPDHLSHSTVQTFQNCPRKWTYKQQGVAPERTPVALAFGIAVHEGIAAINEAMLSGVPLPEAQKAGLATSATAWKEAATKKEAPLHLGSTTREEQEALLPKLLAVYVPPTRIIGVEQPVEINLADDLPPIQGRIDIIRQCESGELVVTDIKTSATRVISDTAPVEAQLSLYSEEYPSVQLEAVVLAKLKTPAATVQSIHPWPRDQLVNMYRETWHAMQAGVRFAVRSNMCGSCQYRDRCRKDG